MQYTVLAADDEVELLEILELYLHRENIRLLKARDGHEALNLYRTETVHLLILDIMMPQPDGYAVLKEVRRDSHVPAIMLTARSADHEKILGLELGADDYIAKPFNPLEVAARVKAQLRRSYAFSMPEAAGEPEILSLHSLSLHIAEGALEKNGVRIPLTSTEFKILQLLMKNPGRIYTKRQIYEQVWDDCYIENDSTLMVHMSNLRSKIEADPKHPEILKTIKGLGYKIEKEQTHEG